MRSLRFEIYRLLVEVAGIRNNKESDALDLQIAKDLEEIAKKARDGRLSVNEIHKMRVDLLGPESA